MPPLKGEVVLHHGCDVIPEGYVAAMKYLFAMSNIGQMYHLLIYHKSVEVIRKGKNSYVQNDVSSQKKAFR